MHFLVISSTYLSNSTIMSSIILILSQQYLINTYNTFVLVFVKLYENSNYLYCK